MGFCPLLNKCCVGEECMFCHFELGCVFPNLLEQLESLRKSVDRLSQIMKDKHRSNITVNNNSNLDRADMMNKIMQLLLIEHIIPFVEEARVPKAEDREVIYKAKNQ